MAVGGLLDFMGPSGLWQEKLTAGEAQSAKAFKMT
jgi:hypothetical protein